MITLNPTQDDITLIQISDTHLLADPDERFVGVKPEQHFSHILQKIKQHFPHMDAVFHTGDVTQDSYPATYERYLNAMRSLDVPFFQTLGNHDNPKYFPNNEPDSPSIQPSVIDLGTWQLIMLNSAVVGRIDGCISQVQLDFLQQHLSTYTKPTLLAFHHHVFEMNSQWLDEHKLKNSQQLLDVIQQFPHVKACFMGHVHQAFHCKWQHIDFYSIPATSVQFKPKSVDFSLDNTAPAYRSLVLKADGTYETELHYLNVFQHIYTHYPGY